MKSAGQIAFEAYRENRGGKNHDGSDTPVWDELTAEIQAAWEVAADAAINDIPDASDDLKHRFQFHPADMQNTKDAHEGVRAACLDAAAYIDSVAPDGREKSLAITSLELAMMWANASIARGDGPKS